jgi:hypothetical protein
MRLSLRSLHGRHDRPGWFGQIEPARLKAGARVIQRGEVIVLGGNLADNSYHMPPIAHRLTRKASLSDAERI